MTGEYDDDLLLTVQEFALQPEVDKHPSQMYGWMKKGLPVVMVDGKKHIPFESGLAWIEERAQARTHQPSLGKGGVPRESPTRTLELTPGTYLRWSRGKERGPAYAMVIGPAGSLVELSVEYRSTPVYFARPNLEADLRSGLVRIVTATEVMAFLLEELSRLDFVLHLIRGPEAAKQLRAALDGVLPQDFIECMHGNDARPAKVWPADESLMEVSHAN